MRTFLISLGIVWLVFSIVFVFAIAMAAGRSRPKPGPPLPSAPTPTETERDPAIIDPCSATGRWFKVWGPVRWPRKSRRAFRQPGERCGNQSRPPPTINGSAKR